MNVQCRTVTREEIYRLIDKSPCRNFIVLKYDVEKRISNNGKRVKKRIVKRIISKAVSIDIHSDVPVTVISINSPAIYWRIKDTGRIKKYILIPKSVNEDLS